MSQKKSHRAICVLGVHRSGTSTITRALNLLGAYLGEENDIMRPLPENPEGFWERLDVYDLQERILASMKRDWATSLPLPDKWHTADEVLPFKDELGRLITANFSDKPLWMWKDPRTCLLFSLWRDVLEKLGIELKVVFVFRNPVDVAKSLERRNGFSIDKGLGIWFNNTIVSLKYIEGLDTVFLSYDDFLHNWEYDLKRCSAALGITWPEDEVELRAKMAAFMRLDLQHSASNVNDLRMVAPEPILCLYEHLLCCVSGDADDEKITDKLYRQFISYTRFFEYDIAALADYRSRIERLAHAPEALPALVELRKELDSRTKWAWKLDQEVKTLKCALASTHNKEGTAVTNLISGGDGNVKVSILSQLRSSKLLRLIRHLLRCRD